MNNLEFHQANIYTKIFKLLRYYFREMQTILSYVLAAYVARTRSASDKSDCAWIL